MSAGWASRRGRSQGPKERWADVGVPSYSPDEARERILDAVRPLPPVELPVLDCLGCVLAEDVTTPHPIPPFPSSGMDG
ncbi:MAG: hypothetical protein ACRD0S_11315, partial [Acidimicrobiales bacterium]